MNPIVLKWSLRGLGALVALILVLGTFYTVSEQDRAVVVRMGEAKEVTGPGVHGKWPMIDSIYHVPVQIQSVNQGSKKANTYTIDNQEVDAEFLVMFRIPQDQVMRVYKEIPDYKPKLQALAFERFKRQMGSVNTADLAQHRARIAQDTLTTLQAEAKRLYGIDVLDFQISDVEYTKSFRSAVEASATAKQRVVQAEQERAQASVDAEKAKIAAVGEANAARETARGKADATLLAAEAEAKSIRLRGDAEAGAIRAQADALKSNPVLVELRKAERWDGALPTSVGLNGTIPMIDVKAMSK